MGLLSNRVFAHELQKGDHIYSWRSGYTYSHHGIYLGDDLVVHFTRDTESGTIFDSTPAISSSSTPATAPSTPCPECGCNEDSHGVIISCLHCFLDGFQLYRFEYGVNWGFFLAKIRGGTCTMASCDSTETVLHRYSCDCIILDNTRISIEFNYIECLPPINTPYRAKYLLTNGFGKYHLFENNCEDFALYCKTRVGD